MTDKLNELLARVEQSENARLLDRHTPEFRLLTELVNRVQETESRLETLYEYTGYGYRGLSD